MTSPASPQNAAPRGLAVLRHRADIQGVRALAVLSVLLFHAGLPWLPGGYVGVDVFFVISGFLITGLLIKELSRTGRVSLVDFYVRRVKRILPAALVVIALTLAAGWAFLPLSRWEPLGWTALWASLSVANWSLAADSTDYFTTDAVPSPLQHYWSLGVEEQFYLVWPLLLLAVVLVTRTRHSLRQPARPPRRSVGARPTGPHARRPESVALRVLAVAGIVGGASFAYSALHTPVDPGASYFITTTRAWELAVGAGLAALVVLMPPLGAAARAVLGWTGLAMVAVAVVAFTEYTVFPGVAAALPVLGSALLILAGAHAVDDRHGGAPGRWLSSRPATWIGDLSYSLYLVHWPLIAIVSWHHPQGLPLWLGLTLAVVSVPLAWLLRVGVEKPFLGAGHATAPAPGAAAAGADGRASTPSSRGHRPGLRALRPIAVGLLCSAVVAGLAVALASTAARQTATPAEAEAVAGAGAAGAAGPAESAASSGGSGSEGTPSDGGSAALTQVDPAWDPVDELDGLAFDEIVPAPAAAHLDGSPLVKRNCHTLADDAEPIRCEDGDPDSETTVMLIGDSHVHHWSNAVVPAAEERDWHVISYAKGACPITTHTVELSAEDGGPRTFTECTQWNEAVMAEVRKEKPDLIITSTSKHLDDDGSDASDGMAEAWRTLVENSEHTVVLADPPHAQEELPACLERHPDDAGACTFDKAQGLEDSGTPSIYAAAEKVPEVEVIDLNDFVCPKDTCAPVVGKALLYTDTNHMTATFAGTLKDQVGERLDAVMAE